MIDEITNIMMLDPQRISIYLQDGNSIVKKLEDWIITATLNGIQFVNNELTLYTFVPYHAVNFIVAEVKR